MEEELLVAGGALTSCVSGVGSSPVGCGLLWSRYEQVATALGAAGLCITRDDEVASSLRARAWQKAVAFHSAAYCLAAR